MRTRFIMSSARPFFQTLFAQQLRYSSKKSLARGVRLRGGGGIRGAKLGGKLSTEMISRSESVLESIRAPRPVVNPIKRWKILRGDTVEVINGPEKGKRGRVLEVVRASNSVVVEGVGFVTKNVPVIGSDRPEKVQTEGPIYVSKVAVVCPETDLPTRVGYAFLEDGTKVRISKRSGAVIPRPEVLTKRRKPKPDDGPKDTPPTMVLQRTFVDEHGLYEGYEGFKAITELNTSSQT